MIKPFNTKVAGRDPIFAKEWNRLTGYIESIMRALMREGYVDSSGIYLRNKPQSSPRVASKIFEVVDDDPTGDGIYDCKEQTVDGSEWSDVAGDDRLIDRNTDQIEVLNILDAHANATYANSLVAGDKMMAWRWTDDDDDSRWIGLPLPVGGFVRRAKTQEAAPADANISVKLVDQDSTEVGAAFDVACEICNGTALNSAIPRLASGDYITVYNAGGVWYCTTVFQVTEDCDCYSA